MEVMANEMFRRINFLEHMFAFKVYQEQYGLFLDLEDKDVIDKYNETYPKGVHLLDFLLMICSMTKDENIFNNKVVRKQLNLLKKMRLKRYKISL